MKRTGIRLFAPAVLFFLALPTARAAHVFVVMEENESFTSVLNNPAMPYFNTGTYCTNPVTGVTKFCPGLVQQGALLNNYFASMHNSAGNYLLLTTGKDLHFKGPSADPANLVYDSSDFPDRIPDVPNILSALFAQGNYGRSYSEDLPTADPYRDGSGTIIDPPNLYQTGNYLRRHNPFSTFPRVLDERAVFYGLAPGDPFNAQNWPYIGVMQDFGSFQSLRNTLIKNVDASASGAYPSFSMIVPNVLHDGHDAPLADEDAWLATNIAPLLDSAIFQPGGDGMLIILWDEAQSSDHRGVNAVTGAVSGSGGGGQVVALVIGPEVARGKYSIPYGHLNLLRTVCDYVGIPLNLCPGDAGSGPGSFGPARPINEIFAVQTIPRRASAAAALPLAPPRPTVTPTPTPTPSGFSVTIAKSQITVGGTQYYTLTGAPINMPVYGAVYITPPGGGEYLYQNAYWGNTNGVGGFAIGSIPYTSSMVGTIRVVFTVAGKSRSVTFTCTAGNTTPGGNTGSGGFGLSVASAPLSVGQTQWYSVSGAPAYSAVWGAVYITPPGGREYLFQNAQWVPSSGNGTFGVGSIPYTSGMVGTIRVVLTIGGVSATVTFTCK